MQSVRDQPFFDLPGALVGELLSRCDPLSAGLYRGFSDIIDNRKNIRRQLEKHDLLHRDQELSNVSYNPTCCGVDGALAHQKLVSTDIAAAAAVAVEGLPPPIEKRYWPDPRHKSLLEAVPHYESTGQILRALMFCMELDLADSAPHNIVMLDGAITSPMLAINQALGAQDRAPPELVELLHEKVRAATRVVLKTLESPHSDQIYVSIPKYTTRKDLKQFTNLKHFEDRGLLSFVLEEGEYFGPIKNTATSVPGIIPTYTFPGFLNRYKQLLANTDIIYYRPYEHTPVLRLETASTITRDRERLSMLLEAIRIQCEAPSIYEPYPLYMADRMVKHLGSVIPTLRSTTTRFIAEKWQGPIHLAYMAMHGYRTETS